MPKATGTKKPRTPRKKKTEPRSKGLLPADCLKDLPAGLAPLVKSIEAAGGSPIGSYRDPLGGEGLVIAALPIEKVQPTPFQRDLSEAHAKRLEATITKLGHYLDPK